MCNVPRCAKMCQDVPSHHQHSWLLKCPAVQLELPPKEGNLHRVQLRPLMAPFVMEAMEHGLSWRRWIRVGTRMLLACHLMCQVFHLEHKMRLSTGKYGKITLFSCCCRPTVNVSCRWHLWCKKWNSWNEKKGMREVNGNTWNASGQLARPRSAVKLCGQQDVQDVDQQRSAALVDWINSPQIVDWRNDGQWGQNQDAFLGLVARRV